MAIHSEEVQGDQPVEFASKLPDVDLILRERPSDTESPAYGIDESLSELDLWPFTTANCSLREGTSTT
jgi:hypothetical protein